MISSGSQRRMVVFGGAPAAISTRRISGNACSRFSTSNSMSQLVMTLRPSTSLSAVPPPTVRPSIPATSKASSSGSARYVWRCPRLRCASTIHGPERDRRCGRVGGESHLPGQISYTSGFFAHLRTDRAQCSQHGDPYLRVRSGQRRLNSCGSLSWVWATWVGRSPPEDSKLVTR